MPDLVAPIVPVADTSAITRGLMMWAAGRHQAQQLELQYQQLAQNEALKYEQFKFEREELAQQMPLQAAQINNLNSEATFHNAEAGYYQTVKAKTAQDQQDALDQVTQYTKTSAERMNGKYGTTEGANELGLLDAEFPAIGSIRAGQVARALNYTKQAREERNSINVLSNLRKNMDDTARQGMGQWANDPIIAATPSQLDYDPATKQFKPNNVWAVNKGSNDPYLTVQGQTGPNGWLGWQIVPPSEAATAKNTRTVTLPKALAESYVTQRDAFRAKASGLAGPPPSTVQAVGQQAQMSGGNDLINVMSPDGKTTGKIPRANIQRALDQGYSTLP